MICGIDEAGRGPLAGPVCAAAVILTPNHNMIGEFPVEILDDSKKLSAAKRDRARSLICSLSFAWGIGWASPSEIDEINILQGSLLAMKRAFLYITSQSAVFPAMSEPIEAVADGLYAPDIPVPCKTLVRADSQIPEVMAASILAKTARDRLMDYYSIFYPEYGYEKHRGYPTVSHRAAIARYGPSPIQRLTFRVSR